MLTLGAFQEGRDFPAVNGELELVRPVMPGRDALDLAGAPVAIKGGSVREREGNESQKQ